MLVDERLKCESDGFGVKMVAKRCICHFVAAAGACLADRRLFGFQRASLGEGSALDGAGPARVCSSASFEAWTGGSNKVGPPYNRQVLRAFLV